MPTPEPGPFPWEDDDEPPGLSIRPLRHADLQAFLAEWDDEEPPRRPPSTTRAPRAGGPGGRPLSPGSPATPPPALVGRPGASALAEYRRRCDTDLAAWTRTLPLRLAATLARWRRRLARRPQPARAGGWPARRAHHRRGGRVAAAVPPERRHGRVAARRPRRATHGHAAPPAGTPWLGGTTRPGRPRLPRQPRPPSHRPGRGLRHRLQAVHRPVATRRRRHPLARPLPAHPGAAGGPLEADRATTVLGMPAVEAVPLVAVHGVTVPWAPCRPTASPWWPPGTSSTCCAPGRPSCSRTRSPGSPPGHASGSGLPSRLAAA